MQQGAEAGDSFNRMADGVAKIQNHAQAGLTLVFADNFGLHAYGCGDDPVEQGGIAGENTLLLALHQAEQRAVADEAGLDTLEQAGAEFA